MRLNEAAQHAWDVRVALDRAAIVDPTSAEVLLEHFGGGLGFLLGFIGKAEHLSEPTRVRIQDTDVVIAIDEQVSLATPATGATATFTGTPRRRSDSIGGRLTAPYTRGCRGDRQRDAGRPAPGLPGLLSHSTPAGDRGWSPGTAGPTVPGGGPTEGRVRSARPRSASTALTASSSRPVTASALESG